MGRLAKFLRSFAANAGWTYLFGLPWWNWLLVAGFPVAVGVLSYVQQLPWAVLLLFVGIAVAIALEVANGWRELWVSRPDRLRRELGNELDKLVVEARAIHEEGRDSLPMIDSDSELLRRCDQWRLRLRVVLLEYGADFVWRCIDEVHLEDPGISIMNRSMTGHLSRELSDAIRQLEARAQALLPFLERCSRTSPHPLALSRRRRRRFASPAL